MRTADYDYALPQELIAQSPARARDESRLLVLQRSTGGIEHRRFPELLHYLQPGDALVMNNSRVIPARLRGTNARTGGKFELLLLEENAANDWWVMLRPGKRARAGTQIIMQDRNGATGNLSATVTAANAEGHRRVRFEGVANVTEVLDEFGEVPLPPYINRPAGDEGQDRERYQTVYAMPAGSVAAPTAGLHFTHYLLHELRSKGVSLCFVTLHVGLGTFAPVKAEDPSDHPMHEERYELTEETTKVLNAVRAGGGRVFAVGTTTVRVLETVAGENGGSIVPGRGRTKIFIRPPFRFQAVDGLLTNFHLPRSTLLMLASAFAAPGELRGREMVLGAYAEAIRQKYRFFSYGDAMLLV